MGSRPWTVLETKAGTATFSPGLTGAWGEMVEYSDMGSDKVNSFTPFCGASFNILSFILSLGDRGDFPGCVGGGGARYLTLPGSAGCRGVVGLAGCTPAGMGGAGDLNDLGLGEILGLVGSPDGAGSREAEGRAVEGKLSV